MRIRRRKRATANMRSLQPGDRFLEDGQVWEVAAPVIHLDKNGQEVEVPLKRYPFGKRSRRYIYDGGWRVRLAHDKALLA